MHPIYLQLVDHAGRIMKSFPQKDKRDEWIEVLHYRHGVEIPTERESGLLTCMRRHAPFSIVKRLCPVSPLLMKSCVSGKVLNTAILSWLSRNEEGMTQEYYRVTLEEVRIVSVQPFSYDAEAQGSDRYSHKERIEMRYQKIRWLYIEGNIEAEDRWDAMYPQV